MSSFFESDLEPWVTPKIQKDQIKSEHIRKCLAKFIPTISSQMKSNSITKKQLIARTHFKSTYSQSFDNYAPHALSQPYIDNSGDMYSVEYIQYIKDNDYVLGIGTFILYVFFLLR
jgi:hypothetical protein